MDEKSTNSDNLQLMRIIIGFSRAKSRWALGSKIIQLVEKRPYSHAFVRYIHPVSSIALVSQASHGQVNMTNFDIFQEKNLVVKEKHYEVTKEKYDAYLKFLHLNLGKPYSRTQLILIGLKKLFGIKVKAENHDSAFICSEWVARALEVIGEVNTSDEDFITPSDLDKLINK